MLVHEDDLAAWAANFRDGKFHFTHVDDMELGMHVFFTLYFYEVPSSMQRREEVYNLCERFVALTGDALNLIYFGRGAEHKVGSKNGQIRGKKENNDPKKDLYLRLTSAKLRESASAFYFDALVNADDYKKRLINKDTESWYSYVRMAVSHEWLQESEHKAVFMQLMIDAANTLQADQGYAGYGYALPLARDALLDIESAECYLAHQFYGMDIDKPFDMMSGYIGMHTLPHGRRSPSWCNFVSERWLDKLGSKAAVIAELTKHPDVEVTDYNNGIMIQTSDMPQLYPVTEPVPHVMVHVAKVLKPIRSDYLNLLSYERFEDDDDVDEVFFEPEKAISWLNRYDEDSTFPSEEVRIPPEIPQLRSAMVITEKRVEAGKPCPNTGYWFTPANANSRAHFERGDTMPDFPDNDWGMTIWQWDESQT